jgi:hypothetical protein
MSADTGSELILSAKQATRGKIKYMRSYTHVFERDDWFVNLLVSSVCFFIPVIGPLVFMGYQYQVIEGFIRRPNEKMSKFKFNQFTLMLSRGIYPVVASLVLQVLMAPFYWMIFSMITAFALLLKHGASSALTIFAAIFIVFAIFVISFVIHLIMGPLMLRAGLSQSFSETFNFRWIYRFVKTMWSKEIMSVLFFMISRMIILIIGMLMCCVGFFPAAALVMLAMTHLTYQQYEIFLANGGEPIPLKEETPCYPVEQPANL